MALELKAKKPNGSHMTHFSKLIADFLWTHSQKNFSNSNFDSITPNQFPLQTASTHNLQIAGLINHVWNKKINFLRSLVH